MDNVIVAAGELAAPALTAAAEAVAVGTVVAAKGVGTAIVELGKATGILGKAIGRAAIANPIATTAIIGGVVAVGGVSYIVGKFRNS